MPVGDTRHRWVCRSCQHIFYENPRVVSGCLVRKEDQILLCRRAIEPRKGLWTFPAGFLERGESSRQGAIRETAEEALADVEVSQLYAQYDLAYISQIYQFYLAELVGGFGVGTESLEVQLFSLESIPWNDLAFPVIRLTLLAYLQDLKRGEFEFRQFEVTEREDWPQISLDSRIQ